jgi:hypothetical protein
MRSFWNKRGNMSQKLYPHNDKGEVAANSSEGQAGGGNHHNVPCRGRKKGFNLPIGLFERIIE